MRFAGGWPTDKAGVAGRIPGARLWKWAGSIGHLRTLGAIGRIGRYTDGLAVETTPACTAVALAGRPSGWKRLAKMVAGRGPSAPTH